jgi:transaldolase
MSEEKLAKNIADFVLSGLDLKAPTYTAEYDPYWSALKASGTELWLDTGDIEEAESIWSADMTALTTNNTLLNKEVQKGIYDELIGEADGILGDLDPEERIVEIGFILNARHALRLIERFGGKVSVELHTDLAHDPERTVRYAERFHRIEPERFIIKVPYTPAGLIATRQLRDRGIPVNMTLGFSARQNYLAARFARPNYVNVFLGRINSYFADNELSDGRLIGEKTTLASQRAVDRVNEQTGGGTRQIAASMRNGEQLPLLSGVDVFTMPVKVARQGKEAGDGSFTSRRGEDYEVELNRSIDPREVRAESLTEVPAEVVNLATDLEKNPPQTVTELRQKVYAYGCGEFFPHWSEDQSARIDADGKIPVHAHWREMIRAGEAGIDTLLNAAGLATFSRDQAALDNRIRSLIQS